MKTTDSDGIIESVELSTVAFDLKRMLRVQFKEFLHSIEDVEIEQSRNACPNIKFGAAKRNQITRHVA
jgi:hypothetical protein